jgi:SET domain-containing protein
MNVRPTSWTHPQVEVRPSPIGGQGVFALAPLRAGETVFLWGGQRATPEEYRAGVITSRSCSAIEEGVYLGKRPSLGDLPDDFVNHSCEPNLWLVDAVTVIARRDVQAGEELTLDYATFYDIDDWVVTEACACGSRICRQRVTGADWRLPELQTRYQGHFTPLLAARIARLEVGS